MKEKELELQVPRETVPVTESRCPIKYIYTQDSSLSPLSSNPAKYQRRGTSQPSWYLNHKELHHRSL